MDAICAVGAAPDSSVVALTQAAMVAWAETMVRDNSNRLVGSGTVAGSRGGGGGRAAGGGEQQPPAQLAQAQQQQGEEDEEGAQPASKPAGPPPRLRMGLDSDGNIVAGLASWDAASLLFATERQARELLAASESRSSSSGGSGQRGGGAPLDFTVRLKNFQLLFSN